MHMLCVLEEKIKLDFQLTWLLSQISRDCACDRKIWNIYETYPLEIYETMSGMAHPRA